MRRTGKTKKRRGCTIRPISSVYAVAENGTARVEGLPSRTEHGTVL